VTGLPGAGPEAVIDAETGFALVQDIGHQIHVRVRVEGVSVLARFDVTAMDDLIAALQDARERAGERIDSDRTDYAGPSPLRFAPRPAPRYLTGAQS
jgi:predicted ATPase